jgi:hypothetical protein
MIGFGAGLFSCAQSVMPKNIAAKQSAIVLIAVGVLFMHTSAFGHSAKPLEETVYGVCG